MISIMRVNGRVVCASKSTMRTPVEKPIPLMRDKYGNRIAPIQYPNDTQTVIWDNDLGVPYNVHSKLPPTEGWATALFWLKRWNITHDELLIFIKNYVLEAGIERATGCKKYKCKDERALKESTLWKKVIATKKKRENNALHHLRFGANKWN